MKKITEMTEQEILALTDEDVQKMIKLRMMEEGIKIMDRPQAPKLFDIEPGDLKVFTIPFLGDFAFTSIEEANAVAEALQNAKTLRKVEYDWSKTGSDYKYLVKKEKYSYSNSPDFSVNSDFVYSQELYTKISVFLAQNKVLKEQAQKDKEEYDVQLGEASEIISEIHSRLKEVKAKYKRLEWLVYKFASDYYPLSDNNEDMAIKFMDKAYSLNYEEKEYILSEYSKYDNPVEA